MTEQEKQTNKEAIKQIREAMKGYSRIGISDANSLVDKIEELTDSLYESDREVERLKNLQEQYSQLLTNYKWNRDERLKLSEGNQRLRKALLTVCQKIVAYGGTADTPRRMTIDEMLEVYQIARKATEREEEE